MTWPRTGAAAGISRRPQRRAGSLSAGVFGPWGRSECRKAGFSGQLSPPDRCRYRIPGQSGSPLSGSESGWASRRSGNQGASGVCEGLPGTAAAIGGIARTSFLPVGVQRKVTCLNAAPASGGVRRRPGVGLTLLHQVQGPQVVRSVVGQYIPGGDQLGVGVRHNRRLVPIEPTAAALATVAHLRLMHDTMRSRLAPSLGKIPSPVRSTS